MVSLCFPFGFPKPPTNGGGSLKQDKPEWVFVYPPSHIATAPDRWLLEEEVDLPGTLPQVLCLWEGVYVWFSLSVFVLPLTLPLVVLRFARRCPFGFPLVSGQTAIFSFAHRT